MSEINNQNPLFAWTGGTPPESDTDVNPIDEAIGMEARTMHTPHLPEGPLTDTIRDKIIARAKKHIAEHNLTNRQVGMQIGVTMSVVVEVLKKKYEGNSDGILRKLAAWLDVDEPRRNEKRPIGFYPTSVFSAILGLAKFVKSNARTEESSDLSHEPPRIAIGWGPAGCGKTLGAKALHADDPNSILVRITQKRGTDVALARAIAVAAQWRGIGGRFASIPDVMARLKGSGRLLILDEGHRISRSGCELIRDLVDECGIPILILGTAEFYVRLTTSRVTGGNVFYDQFSRRVGYVCDLVKGLDGKGGSKRPIFSIEEIRAIFKSDKVRVTPDGIDYLQAIACTPRIGMIGEASVIFSLACRSAVRRDHAVVDESLLRSAAERVLLPAGELATDVLLMIDKTLDRNRTMGTPTRTAASA